MFTCRDGKGGELSSRASNMLYKPPGAVYISKGHFVCACSLEGAFNEENRWYAPPKKTNGDRRE